MYCMYNTVNVLHILCVAIQYLQYFILQHLINVRQSFKDRFVWQHQVWKYRVGNSLFRFFILRSFALSLTKIQMIRWKKVFNINIFLFTLFILRVLYTVPGTFTLCTLHCTIFCRMPGFEPELLHSTQYTYPFNELQVNTSLLRSCTIHSVLHSLEGIFI